MKTKCGFKWTYLISVITNWRKFNVKCIYPIPKSEILEWYYFFDFCFRDWRISHCLSHHLYPNTLKDLEIWLFEPSFQFLPSKNKPTWARFGPLIYSPIVWALSPHFQVFNKLVMPYLFHLHVKTILNWRFVFQNPPRYFLLAKLLIICCPVIDADARKISILFSLLMDGYFILYWSNVHVYRTDSCTSWLRSVPRRR